MISAEAIIRHYKMVPLADEGGFYVETYRANETIAQEALPERYSDARAHGTSILYLLTPDSFSAMHRLKSDETFHFYLGDPVEMGRLYPDGTSDIITMGHDIAAGQMVQVTVPRGVWQGSILIPGGRFALLGCTVAPGFEFADYENGEREALIGRYPDQAKMIERLTR